MKNFKYLICALLFAVSLTVSANVSPDIGRDLKTLVYSLDMPLATQAVIDFQFDTVDFGEFVKLPDAGLTVKFEESQKFSAVFTYNLYCIATRQRQIFLESPGWSHSLNKLIRQTALLKITTENPAWEPDNPSRL